MALKILGGVVVLIALFLAYVAMKPPTFKIERSIVINAPAEKIFPYLSQLRRANEWSPYAKMDPEMKSEFGGADGAPGSYQQFEGKKSGSGRLTILSLKPNEEVDCELHMTSPFDAKNHVVYSLKPEGTAGTRMTWLMEGENTFATKLIHTLINMDKLVGGQFEDGLTNLKTLAEKP